MEETAAGPQPKSESIFTVDLEDNGGQFSPSSYAELTQRLTAEQQFWSWAMQRQHGGHEIGFREALGDLNNAINSANQWQQQDKTQRRLGHSLTRARTTLSKRSSAASCRIAQRL